MGNRVREEIVGSRKGEGGDIFTAFARNVFMVCIST